MPILEQFRELAASPRTVICPEMQLIGRDHEPPLIIGSGEFRCISPNQFTYTLTGNPEDAERVRTAFLIQQLDRYDGLLRFRVLATDEQGQSYNLGWTVPTVEEDGAVWTCTDEFQSILTGGRVEEPPSSGSTEVAFLVPRKHYASHLLPHIMREIPDSHPRAFEHTVDVLNTPVTFRFEPGSGLLFAAAPATEALPLTFTENWLGEPLMILFGQLVFPRMTARRFSDGSYQLHIRRSPPWIRDTEWVSLYQRHSVIGGENFWPLYASLLTYIAEFKDVDGQQKFEHNDITRRYEEVIQAAVGSRWVTAMTLASSIEGLVSACVPAETPRADADEAAIESLSAHIDTWLPQWVATVASNNEIASVRTDSPADMNSAFQAIIGKNVASPLLIDAWKRLPGVAADAARRTVRTSTMSALFALKTNGVVSQEQIKSWKDVRHPIMHGDLISPYSSLEQDTQLANMSAMMSALTLEVVRRAGRDRA